MNSRKGIIVGVILALTSPIIFIMTGYDYTVYDQSDYVVGSLIKEQDYLEKTRVGIIKNQLGFIEIGEDKKIYADFKLTENKQNFQGWKGLGGGPVEIGGYVPVVCIPLPFYIQKERNTDTITITHKNYEMKFKVINMDMENPNGD
jgi:hypothetical protein